ncbi:MAG: EF2563 family selenium-dependent molybdenum hydroxylase system protein [Chloroflexi bacterium]|jgi:xanthine dehydrogenase accessory factor|nr:EF2563 family selenium-dependent molybdenum hydroxylase system protein [Chloroflexota bacterium]
MAIVLLRGGGDLASGAALRLHRAGLKVIICELPQPLVVRRSVSFAEAVFTGETRVEEVRACLAKDLEGIKQVLDQGDIAVVVDPAAETLENLKRANSPLPPALVLVDGRMRKQPPETGIDAAPLVIGLGPGFSAGKDCHAVIETNRGHRLGRVIWEGSAEADTGIPERVADYGAERVLRAPVDGTMVALAQIADRLEAGQPVAQVNGAVVRAPFAGVLRGLLHPGIPVQRGMKIGDVDPRSDPRYCYLISDKSLAVGGGVMEAILARPDIREHLW